MPEYRIINAKTGAATGKPFVEVQLIAEGRGPTLQARNPGEGWTDIAWLTAEGSLGLFPGADDVKGLSTQNGEIKTF